MREFSSHEIMSNPEVWGSLRKDVKVKFMAAASEKEKRAVFRDHVEKLEASVWPLEKNMENLKGKRDIFARKIDAWDEIDEVAKDPKLQRLGESCFHKLVEDVNSGKIILPTEKDKDALGDGFKWMPNPTTMVFVVQHEWGAAFANAKDFDEGGPIRLPYDDAVFEFRISGRRVCCCIGSEDGVAAGFILYIQTAVGWAMSGYNTIENGDWKTHISVTEIAAPIFNLIRLQVRAICIALDAEIAVTEVVRAPYRLNIKRERHGKIPIYDHHIISLASRKMYSTTLESDDEESAKKRLHFVRGHWRHLPAHKTWIKWHLRGDPGLGFIDKEYRL